jgi:hypothetical protein
MPVFNPGPCIYSSKHSPQSHTPNPCSSFLTQTSGYSFLFHDENIKVGIERNFLILCIHWKLKSVVAFNKVNLPIVICATSSPPSCTLYAGDVYRPTFLPKSALILSSHPLYCLFSGSCFLLYESHCPLTSTALSSNFPLNRSFSVSQVEPTSHKFLESSVPVSYRYSVWVMLNKHLQLVIYLRNAKGINNGNGTRITQLMN